MLSKTPVLVPLCLFVACVPAPRITITDRRTALEEQASGWLRPLEQELTSAGIVPGPTPMTRAEIERRGVAPERLALFEEEDDSVEARIDRLLVARCLGEARDGTLVETSKSCTTEVNLAQLSQILEQENRGRFQVWRYLLGRRPGAGEAEVRRRWRELHLLSVICGAQVQRDDGAWVVKECG